MMKILLHVEHTDSKHRSCTIPPVCLAARGKAKSIPRLPGGVSYLGQFPTARYWPVRPFQHRAGKQPPVASKALGGRPSGHCQISICSEISKASSTSMPRYRTVDSSLCPEVQFLLCEGWHNKKNWLFTGSEAAGKRAAKIQSLLATAKANGIEPLQWLTDTLERLPTWPNSRIDELLPIRKPPALDV